MIAEESEFEPHQHEEKAVDSVGACPPSPQSSSASGDPASQASSSVGSAPEHLVEKPNILRREVYDENDDDDDVSSIDSTASEEESVASEGTADLLERAQGRLQLQQLKDEVVELKVVLDEKDKEIESLRRQVTSKGDNVKATPKRERQRSEIFNLNASASCLLPALDHSDHGIVQQLKKANLSLVESQSEMEKDLLNEIIKLSQQLKDVQQKHLEELDARDEKHRKEIAKLKKEIRQLKHNEE